MNLRVLYLKNIGSTNTTYFSPPKDLFLWQKLAHVLLLGPFYLYMKVDLAVLGTKM